MNHRYLSILLGVFILLLSGCGGGGGSSSGQATLTVSVSGIDKQASQFQTAPVALEKVVDFVFPKAYAGSGIPVSVTRLIITVTDLGNQTLASGDVVAMGGALTTTVPAGEAFTVTAQAFNGNNKLLYTGTSHVDALVAGQLAHIAVNMTVSNVAPVASNGALNNALSGTLLASDTNGDTLTFSIVSQPTLGTVSITDVHTGAYVYTPNSGASGTDSFTFKVNDGAVDSNVATVTVTFLLAQAGSVAPVASNGALTSGPGSTEGTLQATGANGDTLTFSIVSQPTLGTVNITDVHTGTYTYTPFPGSSGTDSFTFKVNDGTVDSNIATVTVDVSPGNSAPVASNDTLSIGPTGANGTLHASDANGDVLTFSIVSQPKLGTVTITDAQTGAYTYTPDPEVGGTSDSFTFKVNDGTVDSNIATVTVVMASIVAYSNNFDSPVIKAAGVTDSLSINTGGTWLTAGEQGLAGLGPTGNQFAGNLERVTTATTVTLTLDNLPAHSALSLQFLFAAIDALDGSGTYPSGDYLNVTVDGVSVFYESFENTPGTTSQSYVPPAGGELALRLKLGSGESGSYIAEGAYNMALEPRFQHIAHTASSVTITFASGGDGVQELHDELWEMDNLRVILHH